LVLWFFGGGQPRPATAPRYSSNGVPLVVRGEDPDTQDSWSGKMGTGTKFRKSSEIRASPHFARCPDNEHRRAGMPHYKGSPTSVRANTALLTRGFDPMLSVGSARSSTYVFSSPEAAERAFAIATGKATPDPDEKVELIYSRISHPNAEILEDQIVPIELGASEAAVFNSGMAAILTAFLTFCRPGHSIIYTEPVYGGTQHLIHDLLAPFGIQAKGTTPSWGRLSSTRSRLAPTWCSTRARSIFRGSAICCAAWRWLGTRS
jgi:hypothetical protein